MTTNHIQMFAKAKEIQDKWKPEVGDRYWDGKIYIFQSFTVFKDVAIFLPSIEQMAGMWHEGMKAQDWADTKGTSFLNQLKLFISKYLYAPSITDSWPEEIIVLAFLQHDLYNLVWSEKEGVWVGA